MDVRPPQESCRKRAQGGQVRSSPNVARVPHDAHRKGRSRILPRPSSLRPDQAALSGAAFLDLDSE
jgi:hypothetical protein